MNSEDWILAKIVLGFIIGIVLMFSFIGFAVSLWDNPEVKKTISKDERFKIEYHDASYLVGKEVFQDSVTGKRYLVVINGSSGVCITEIK